MMIFWWGSGIMALLFALAWLLERYYLPVALSGTEATFLGCTGYSCTLTAVGHISAGCSETGVTSRRMEPKPGRGAYQHP